MSLVLFFFSSRRRHTRYWRDWSSDVCSSDLFAKANPTLVIKGGVLDGKPLDANEVSKLADLESREVLMGKLAGAMIASLSQAVHLLNAPISQAARLAGALQAKLDESGQDTFGSLAGGAAQSSAESAAAEE